MRAWSKIGWTALLLGLLLPVGAASAQTRMIVVGGWASSSLVGEDAVGEYRDRNGVHLGVFADVPIFGRYLTLTPGGTFMDRGFHYPDGISSTKLQYLVLSAPVRVNVPAGPVSLGVFAGPGFGLAFGCTFLEEEEGVKRSTTCEPGELQFKSWDVTGVIGAGLMIPVANDVWLVLNTAVDTSLLSIDTGEPQLDFKNRTLLVNAGVSFPLGQR